MTMLISSSVLTGGGEGSRDRSKARKSGVPAMARARKRWSGEGGLRSTTSLDFPVGGIRAMAGLARVI
jgi:hypothetical protein